jgi:zinc/manganese transport system substrate-binding protein
MMRTRFALCSLVLGLTILAPGAVAAEKLKVVASFSILGDLVQRIGGDAVDLTTLVGPDQDAHGFEPSANDQREVAGADMLVANGLGFETWLDRLTDAAGFKGQLVVATTGIEALGLAAHDDDEHEQDAQDHAEEGHDDHDHDAHHDHGEFDPHAFQDAQLVLRYIDNIAAGLTAARPDAAAFFQGNADALKAEFTALDAELKAGFTSLPAEHRRVLTSHDAFAYFGRAYGIEFVGLQGSSTESEPTAQDLKEVIGQIQSGHLHAVFLENMTDPRFVETLAADTGIKVGGELFADALSGPDGPAPDLLSLFRHNQSELMKALQ